MEGSFRGFPAPASLKLSVAADPTVGVGRRFPGLPSPGLIEANGMYWAVNPASTARFRGFPAPASLKPLWCVEVKGFTRLFPGLPSPGLIEARGAFVG